MQCIKLMLLMMAFLLIWNSDVYSQNITDLIRNYEKCKSPQTCRANEFQLINIFLIFFLTQCLKKQHVVLH